MTLPVRWDLCLRDLRRPRRHRGRSSWRPAGTLDRRSPSARLPRRRSSLAVKTPDDLATARTARSLAIAARTAAPPTDCDDGIAHELADRLPTDSRAPGRRPHPRAGPLPPGQRRHQPRPRSRAASTPTTSGSSAGRHRRAPLGRPGRDGRRHGRGGRRARRWPTAGSPPADVDLVIVATCTMPDPGARRGPAARRPARHRRARRLRHQLRLLRASSTRSAPRRPRSRPARPATCWSSPPSGSPAGST